MTYNHEYLIISLHFSGNSNTINLYVIIKGSAHKSYGCWTIVSNKPRSRARDQIKCCRITTNFVKWPLTIWLISWEHTWWGAFHNCWHLTEWTKLPLWGGGGVNEKNVDSIHFQHLNPFFILFMAKFPFEKSWCVHFLKGTGWSEKVCFVHSFKCWPLWMDPNYGHWIYLIQIYKAHSVESDLLKLHKGLYLIYSKGLGGRDLGGLLVQNSMPSLFVQKSILPTNLPPQALKKI